MRERHSTFNIQHSTLLVIALYALLALIVIPVFPHFLSPNEFTRWVLVASVVEDHTIEVSRAAALLGPQFEDLSVKDGRELSNKAPGAALAAAPGYLLARPFAGPPSPENLRAVLTAMRWFGATLPMLLLAMAFARFAAERGGETALPVAALLFATPLFAYGLLLFAHALVAAALFGAWLLLYLRERGGIVAGALIGLAVMSEYPAAIPALVLLSGVAWQRQWRRLALAIAGGAPFALALALYHQAAFGSIVALPSAFEKMPQFRELARSGVFGVGIPRAGILLRLLFDPARGLFLFAPVLVVSLLALRRARAALPRTAFVMMLATPAAIIAVYAGYPNWHGGWNVGPRYIVAAIPFLLFPLAFTQQRRAAAFAVGASVIAVVPITLSFPFPDRSFALPWATLAWPLLRDGLAAPNLLHSVIAPFVIVAAGLAVALRRHAVLALAGAVVMIAAGALAARGPSMTQRLRVGYIEEVYFERPGAMQRRLGGLPPPPAAAERARRERALPPTSWRY